MKLRRIFVTVCTASFLALAIACAAAGAGVGDPPTVTFRKVFKSSYPEFVEIKVNQAGTGTFDIRQLDEDSSPMVFEIGVPLVQRIFDLARRLQNFQGQDLDVHRRIANLGEKTFRYQKGSESHQVTFNYTLNESAAQLLNIFEGLSRQVSDLANLQRVMRYDHLGVNDALLQLETDYNNKNLPEPERLLPTLDQVAADATFVDIARQRARILASKIRGPR